MNIKIKDKDPKKVELLASILLNKPHHPIEIFQKGKSFFTNIELFNIELLLQNIASVRQENDNLNLIILGLENENKGLRAQINKSKGQRQDLGKNAKIIAVIGLLREVNKLSYQAIANKLNKDGFTNSRGNKFNRMLVKRLHLKYEMAGG